MTPPDAAGNGVSTGRPMAVDPSAIERELAALWRPAAETAGGGAEPPAVTRVSVGTHVVAAPASEAGRLEAVLDEVSLRQPSRALLVLVDPAAGAEVKAALSAACHLPAPGQPQVCSERVAFRTGPAGLDRLPGMLLPLLEPDVPATVVWALRSTPSEAIVRDLLRVVDRCVADLTFADDPAASWRSLSTPQAAFSDLAWWRARAWREGVAQFFDAAAGREALGEIDAVEVETAARSEAELVPSALLAGWVTAQLGWSLTERETEVASRWRTRDGREARVTLRRAAVGDERPGRLQELVLRAGDEAYWHLQRLHDRPRELRLETCHRQWCQMPVYLPAPRPDPAQVLLTALTARLTNPVRDRAMAATVALLGWQLP